MVSILHNTRKLLALASSTPTNDMADIVTSWHSLPYHYLSLLHIITWHSVPSPPLNLTVTHVEDKKVGLSWVRPINPNGEINGYRVYYMRGNFTSVRTVYDVFGEQQTMRFNLTEMGEWALFLNKIIYRTN